MTPLLTETSEQGWDSPPQALEGGNHLICSYADVTRGLKDARFLSVLDKLPEATTCPWLRFQQLVGISRASQPLLPPHQLHGLLQKSFIYHEGKEYERMQRPAKKLFLSRLQSIQENLRYDAEQHLAEASGNKKQDWVQDVIRPYINSGIKILFDYPDNLEPDLHAWFTVESVRSILGASSDYSRTAHENFSKAAAFTEKCMDSPGLNNTNGLIRDICRLSEKPASLTREEIFGNILFLLLAAAFSIPRTISASLRTLLRRPELLQQLQDNPSLIATAVPELLRTHPPLTLVTRQVGEDLVIHNVKLKKGSWVYFDVKNANMDPRVFPSPEQIILGRSPNPHLSFGAGTHFCFGAPMARLQMEIFLKAFIKQNLTTPFELCPAPKGASTVESLWVRRQS